MRRSIPENYSDNTKLERSRWMFGHIYGAHVTSEDDRDFGN
jgi:hypothetical protein